MTPVFILIITSGILVRAIILLWIATVGARSTQRVLPYAPIYILSFAFCMSAVRYFYGLFLSSFHSAFLVVYILGLSCLLATYLYITKS